jgi:hypothetical protein
MRQENRARCLELLSAFGISQVLRVAAVLRLADHLAGSNKTAVKLAEITSTHPAALHRLLRALASIGITSEEAGGAFALTPLGRVYFASGSEESLEALARYLGHPTCWATWAELLYSIKTGDRHSLASTARAHGNTVRKTPI